jgi:hypothetical protein
MHDPGGPVKGTAVESAGTIDVSSLKELVAKLSRASREQARSPYELLDWPESLGPEQGWCTSPELSSLWGTQWWDNLDEAGRRRLCFWEAVNFYSLNIHGERWLMEGLVRRLYDPDLLAVADYVHHFLDEENKHSVLFGTFCRRYGRIYPHRAVVFVREMAPGEENLLFFTKVLIFEEIVDRYNVQQADDDRVHPVARAINHNHHAEEARHLIFGRSIVRALWDMYAPQWDEEKVADIRRYLAAFIEATWRQYYSPDAYRDAGLADPYAIAREAWDHPTARRHREVTSDKSLRFLVRAGIFDGRPHL